MLFILLLILAAGSVAATAAFFSVYGLAHTFSGVFWSVAIMGASLEFAKLVTASYLYRYWTQTQAALKSYMLFAVFCLMLLTSVGIFSYLSSGYQTDILPLRQITEQVTLLEQEKARKLDRKKQIDDQIAKLPDNSVRGRERLVRQFKEEQAQVGARANQLDQELLSLKQQVIKTEAHIGPITYIAKAFGMDTDNATKYLIFLIIFAFDPMAVALTLAVNIALRQRELSNGAVTVTAPQAAIIDQPVHVVVDSELHQPLPTLASVDEQVVAETSTDPTIVPLEPVISEPQTVSHTTGPVINVSETQDATIVPAVAQKVAKYPPYTGPNRFNNWDLETAQANIKELLEYYSWLKENLLSGSLTPQEAREKSTIEDILARLGYRLYL